MTEMSTDTPSMFQVLKPWGLASTLGGSRCARFSSTPDERTHLHESEVTRNSPQPENYKD
jgi:hypothetical protein